MQCLGSEEVFFFMFYKGTGKWGRDVDPSTSSKGLLHNLLNYIVSTHEVIHFLHIGEGGVPKSQLSKLWLVQSYWAGKLNVEGDKVLTNSEKVLNTWWPKDDLKSNVWWTEVFLAALTYPCCLLWHYHRLAPKHGPRALCTEYAVTQCSATKLPEVPQLRLQADVCDQLQCFLVHTETRCIHYWKNLFNIFFMSFLST